jgi:hypothetical protein
VHCLARDAGISQATGYRYLHDGWSAVTSTSAVGVARSLGAMMVIGRCGGVAFVGPAALDLWTGELVWTSRR